MEGLSMNNTLTRARNESRIKPLPIIIVIAALALLPSAGEVHGAVLHIVQGIQALAGALGHAGDGILGHHHLLPFFQHRPT